MTCVIFRVSALSIQALQQIVTNFIPEYPMKSKHAFRSINVDNYLAGAESSYSTI